MKLAEYNKNKQLVGFWPKLYEKYEFLGNWKLCLPNPLIPDEPSIDMGLT